MYIGDITQKRWIQQRLEARAARPVTPMRNAAASWSGSRRRDAGALLHTKYVGQKRFSLEGGTH